MSAAKKHHVIIKGTKDSLVFLLDDECEFEQLLQELKNKLDNTHQQILTGPSIYVDLRLGARQINEVEEFALRQLINRKGNLVVRSLAVKDKETDDVPEDDIQIMHGIVRSGQTVQQERSILFLGDVNPGGSIFSSGDIYVMGSLRGMAHAGIEGDESKVIAASHFQPTQLRIADIISRPPEEWNTLESYMEFAYIKKGKMEIARMKHYQQLLQTKAKGEI